MEDNHLLIATDIMRSHGHRGDLWVVARGERDYFRCIPISNTIRQTRPLAVAYCRSFEAVRSVLTFAQKSSIPIRIRSGGHQHEGHCSADGAIVIDVSHIDDVQFFLRGDEHPSEHPLWSELEGTWGGINGVGLIGTGCKFSWLYDHFLNNGCVIAGGGCGSVTLGGFAQGGGWGPYTRLLGIGAQNIIGVHLVLPNGKACYIFDDCLSAGSRAEILRRFSVAADPVIATREIVGDDPQALLSAIRGGGGGNFGVVIHLFYRVHRVASPIVDLLYDCDAPASGEWQDTQARIRQILEVWDSIMATAPPELTTACRLVPFTQIKPAQGKPVVIVRITGRFVGQKSALDELMKPLTDLVAPRVTQVDVYDFPTQDQPPFSLLGGAERTSLFRINMRRGDHLALFDNYDFGFSEYLTPHPPGGRLREGRKGSAQKRVRSEEEEIEEKYAKLVEKYKAPTDTCSAPLPHKVTSFFPKNGADHPPTKIHSALINASGFAYKCHSEIALVNRTIGLHGLGGNVVNFPRVRTAFVFGDRPYIIQTQSYWAYDEQGFNESQLEWVRTTRSALNVVSDGSFINFPDDTAKAEHGGSYPALMQTYYGPDFNALRALRARVDPLSVFSFPMAIPH